MNLHLQSNMLYLIQLMGDKMKKIEQEFNKIILIEMTFSVMYALLGLFIFLKSETTNKTVGLLIGTFFLIYGLIELFSFFNKKKLTLFRYNLIFGILNLIIGIFIMFNPLSILNILNLSLGIGLLLDGVNKMVYFFYIKKWDKKSSRILIASGLLIIFLGIMIIINPFLTLVITKTIGIFIILYNILNLNDLVLLKRKFKNFKELFK